MKLVKATYRNFKGIKEFTFEPGGNNAQVYGDNATGKTTLQDGVLYLLFGKDSMDKKDFSIKTLTPDGQPIHYLDHEVEAEFEIGGKALMLKKSFKEKWTRKRGTPTDEFTGHTTDHFVDGVPIGAREYADKIAGICDEDTFKLLTSHGHFNTVLHWEKRRAVLLEVCGDVSESEVIAADKALKELPRILGERTVEERKKAVKVQQVAVNSELKKIPIRIDEAERGLPDTTGLSKIKLTAEKAELEMCLEAAQAEMLCIKSGGAIAEMTKRVRELEAEMLDIKNAHRKDLNTRLQERQWEAIKLKATIGEKDIHLKAAERLLISNEEACISYEAELVKLREQWHEVTGTEFRFAQADTCPSCGQALPTEKLEEAREKALASFNREKAELLEGIGAKGKRQKAESESLGAESEDIRASITAMENTLAADQGTLDKLQDELDRLMTSAPDLLTTPEYGKTAAAKEKLEGEIAALRAGTMGLQATVQQELATIYTQIQAVEGNLRKFTDRVRGEARINELATEEKKLAAEYERLERSLFLMEQFTRAKVTLLEGKINSKFQYARFKLFKENINGGIEDCCETLYNGIPFGAGLNSGHRGIVGLDIISALCEHYGFWPPVFYDNAESLTKLPEMRNQMICLYASEPDKQMRVEVTKNKEEK